MATSDNNLEQEFDVLLKAYVPQSSNVGDCHQFNPDDATAYLENAMTRNAQTSFENHLVDCRDCRRHIIEFSRLLPRQVEIPSPVINPTPFSERLSNWLSGWRLGAIAGLGAVTATALLLIVFANRSTSELSPMVVSQNKDAVAPLASPIPTVANDEAENLGGNLSPLSSTSPIATKAGEKTAGKGTPTQGAAPKASVSEPSAASGVALSSEAPPPPPPPAPVPTPAPSKTAGERKEVAAPTAAAGASATQSQANNFRGQTQSGPETNQLQAERALEVRKREASQTSDMISPAEPTPKKRVSDNEKIVEKGKKDVADEADRKRPAAKPAMRVATTQPAPSRPSRTIGGKVFYQEGGVWIDAAYSTDRRTSIVRLKRDSNEYKQILKDIPALKPYFDLNPVIVEWEGKVYRVENK